MKPEKTKEMPITETTSNDGGASTMDLELEAARAEAFAQMTPPERYRALLDEKALAVDKATYELLQSDRRDRLSVETQGAALMQQSDKAYAKEVERRATGRSAFALLMTLDNVQGTPTFYLRGELALDVRDGDIDNATITSVPRWDDSEGHPLLLGDVRRETADLRADAEHRADAAALAALDKHERSRSNARGITHRRWAEITQPALGYLTSGKTVRALLNEGRLKLEGEPTIEAASAWSPGTFV